MAESGAIETGSGKGPGQGDTSTPNLKIYWSTQKVDGLISLFKQYPCLYDRTSREYSDKLLRSEALKTIARELQLLPSHSDEVFRKIVNLRSQFRREKHREVKFVREGNDPETAAAHIKWIHYKQLKFLDSFVTLRNPRNEHVQYSQVNGFGDFDESLDDDIDYDCNDLDEYKVGEAEDCQIHVGNSAVGEGGHPEDPRDNAFTFLHQSPLQDGGAKRQRMDSGNMPMQFSKRQGMYDFMPGQAQASAEPEGQERQQSSQSYESMNSIGGRGNAGSSSQQNPMMMQRAQSFLQQALTCIERVGGTPMLKRRREEADDEDMVFARYIASELRQLKDSGLKRLVKHQIQNLVFEAHQKVPMDADLS